MGSANERWCYNVTSSLIGWAHTQNDPYIGASTFGTETHNIVIAQIPCLVLILDWQVTGTQHSTIWGLKRLLYDNGMTMTMVGQMKRHFYLEKATGYG